MKRDRIPMGPVSRRGWLVGLLILLVVGPSWCVAAAESPVGRWKTVDEAGKVKSEVEIYEQGGKIFGRIVRLSDPNDAQGKPRTCTQCTGADKDKSIVGLVIIRDLGASDGRYKGGTIVDPEDGKVYRAEIWVEEGKLKVRGYLGFFYKTQTWLKAA
jgi:uncharacterized protein (DUF2147 family)